MKVGHRLVLIAVVLGGFGPRGVQGTFHFNDVNEVYTSADGSIQYVELISQSAIPQTMLGPTHVEALNADGTVTMMVFDFTATFSGSLNNGDTLLIATPGFQAVAGFAPDFVMARGSLTSFPDGRVIFDRDGVGSPVDSVAYGDYTGSNSGFGLPAAALPFDGIHSLTRVSSRVTPNNAVDFAIRTNSPRRNDGCTTTLSAAAFRDCNATGTLDSCDLRTQGSQDANHNAIPDECEARGDFDGDADVDLVDYRRIHDCLDGPDGGILPGCDRQDLTGDEVLDLLDVARFQNAFGTAPP